ncbi:bifunctional glutamate N-acetyltransferase/amino-acid acetyltransferase ArgJ [Glycomyces sp. TRM65418]|uniref:bifunctional glutamate N-acetyltransferase/amino-acid acetyltransferase ArgJ n=1 Tax=Glycomyces sp. TRM65418 TaxID=2867006 RepID=UPI001CE5DDA5|nr:bifunctional glutamate N-acetyltransferase/amino-acid acetyltransferase ArgJ [Glycomyces sp. TRM65418]MCC3761902.1 bifunctional glutamate N-acetyltransferase/amino-acid acetyltransferase ArgJ [Glycomyces sp. TRM65418]QZD55983.1 bifunctional glutamate N-acetyltransferase/amino-acid acetyltransferase ArgJ [Glycomyces sp. TRM65418]
MTVTTPKGFTASGVTAGLKASGRPDVALVVNEGPLQVAAGRFTGNRVKAAPVKWSQQVLTYGKVKAVILNSGGANACTGAEGFQNTHATAEKTAEVLGCGAVEIAVCSTGLIGEQLPMDKLLPGVEAAAAALAADGGEAAATAIMTTDTVAKHASITGPAGWTVGGIAKGAGMLAPGLATMLVVLTTDAVIDGPLADAALGTACRYSFDRLDSDGSMSTNDTVLLLASGASGVEADADEFTAALTDLCKDLARQLLSDAEGSTKDVAITVSGAATEDDAVEVARCVARDNLVKTALFGSDPNWGRILAAVGVSKAPFDADAVDVAVNGVWICKAGAAGESRDLVDLTGRDVAIDVELHNGAASATIWTNDLSHDYVHENSAYST